MTAAFSPPFPTNPNVGDEFCGWTWNGSIWVCTSGQSVIIQTFLASAPYTPSPGLIGLVVECIGGGGSGGAAQTNAAIDIFGGGGGGSGGYSKKALAASLVRGGVLVTIGQGGSDVSATNGTATMFGSLCVANGGASGSGTNGVNVYGWGGAGASPGIGDVAMPGAPGASGLAGLSQTIHVEGAKGGQMWGGGAVPNNVGQGAAVVGNPASPNTGAGGCGAVVNALLQTTPVLGGAGGSGVCWVTEYCFADQGGSWSPGGCGGGQARVAWPQGAGHPGYGGFDD